MEWFYVENGERVGPIDEATFRARVSQGSIQADTLVWNANMTDWRAWGEVSGGPPPAMPGADPVARVCIECGQAFNAADGVVFRGQFVCTRCKPTFFSRVQQGSALPAMPRYAGFWTRFGAKFIDNLIVMIPSYILIFGVAAVLGDVMNQPGNEPIAIVFGLMFQFMPTLFYAAYNTYFIGSSGATPGKRIMKIKVVRPNGEPITYARALGRYGGELISGIICSIGYIMAAFDDEKRSLHDRICDTRVVMAEESR